jgi:transcription-repair coupling factor (superfamily II helicase)
MGKDQGPRPKAMQDMADELLKLYAERKTAQGFQYLQRQPVHARV